MSQQRDLLQTPSFFYDETQAGTSQSRFVLISLKTMLWPSGLLLNKKSFHLQIEKSPHSFEMPVADNSISADSLNNKLSNFNQYGSSQPKQLALGK